MDYDNWPAFPKYLTHNKLCSTVMKLCSTLYMVSLEFFITYVQNNPNTYSTHAKMEVLRFKQVITVSKGILFLVNQNSLHQLRDPHTTDYKICLLSW